MAGKSYDVLGSPFDTNEERTTGTPGDEAVAAAEAAAQAAALAASTAGTAASAAQGAATSATSAVTGFTGAVSAGVAAVNSAAATATVGMDVKVAAAEAAAQGAQDQADAAAAGAALSRRWAADPPGVFVDDGLESARAYAEDMRGLIGSSPSTPVTILGDPPSGAGAYDLAYDPAAHLYRKLVFRGTARAATIRLGVNAFTSPWPGDNGPAAAWTRVKREHGAAAVTLAAATGGGVISPSRIAGQPFAERLAAAATVDTSRTYRLTVPAGADRRVVTKFFSLYEASDATRSTRCAATVVGGSSFTMTRVIDDNTTAAFNASVGTNNLDMAAHVGVVPGSAACQIDVTLTFSPQAFVWLGMIDVAKETSGHAVMPIVADTGEVDNLVSLSGTIAQANSLVLLSMAQKNRDGNGLVTLSSGTSRDVGRAPPNADATLPDGQRTMTYIHGDELVSTAGTKTWTATFPGSTRRGNGMGVILLPKASVAGVAIDAVADVLAIPAGGEALIEPLSDGITYHVHVAG